MDAVALEMKAIQVTFQLIDEDKCEPVGYQFVKCVAGCDVAGWSSRYSACWQNVDDHPVRGPTDWNWQWCDRRNGLKFVYREAERTGVHRLVRASGRHAS